MPEEPMDVLRQIVAADKAARRRVEKAGRDKENFDARLEKMSRSMQSRLEAENRRELDQIRAASEKETAEQLAQREQEQEREMARLQKIFAERRAEGVEKMFRMVVGLDD